MKIGLEVCFFITYIEKIKDDRQSHFHFVDL
jgi:hypothetical protein